MEQLNLLDAITIVEFIVTLMNYDDTKEQSNVTAQITQAVSDIHDHIIKQNKTLDEILHKVSELEKAR